ncbi:hypothetical protein DVA86_18130 [Streptomyces armeniacus]|uniref:Proteinase inhibitor I36 SMPI n=1 Tax=Streptomyces armeniacus TaxID=83291 RepID=A0A345Y0M0_9ACTN|nr:peptidase inhibitor family I36 protein [Streptomyces armeniacus]AXK37436.1 hypothetical protein DVA86_18130 [Streptomyces armeniacus]
MNSHHASAAGCPSRVPSGRPAGTAATVLTAAAAVALATAVLAPAQAAAAPQDPRAAAGELGDCGAGQLCLWEQPQFEGKRQTYELAGTDTESCVVLPDGFAAEAYANRTGRPVTVYQSAECAETGEFHTHPGGSYTPESAYQVRAFKIWER